MSLPKRTIPLALTITLLSLGVAPMARAGVLDDLTSTLSQQASPQGAVISESGASPIPPQVENQVQNTVGGLLNRGVGQVSGAVGNIFGGLGGQGGILGSILSPFEQQMQQYIGIAQGYLQHTLGDIFGSIFGGGGGSGDGGGTWADGAVLGNVPPGAMGIPDFYKVQKAIEQQTNGGANGEAPGEAQRADRFNVNPVVLTQSINSDRDRETEKTLAATVLSDEGQQTMDAERQAASQTLQGLQAKAQEAQGMDVTQDVMKNLTAMVAGQSALESGSYAHTMMIHQQLAANGIVEANISAALDETNRTRHVEAIASASDLKRAAAGIYLPGS